MSTRWVHWLAQFSAAFIFGMALDGVTSLSTIALMLGMFAVVVVAIVTSPTRRRNDRRERVTRSR